MRKLFNLCCFLTLAFNVVCQVHFNQDSGFGLKTQTQSTTVMSVVDLNGDLLDDVVSLDKGFNLTASYQTPSGNFLKVVLFENLFNNAPYSITFGDYDENGFLDILVAGESVPLLFYQNEDHTFRRDFLGQLPFVAQSANSVDIDGDGKLDIFICDDNDISKTYKNEGTTLNPFTFLDMTTKESSDNSGNYSSVWLDVDKDGDLDLYIGKCRSGVDEASDPRRINALYINNNGVFEEQASAFNIDIGRQTWSTSTGDLDNDGDEDIFITNHYSQSQILVNQNTHFDVLDLDLKEFFGIQGVIVDIDLDGLQDIIISSLSDEILLLNQGNLIFEADYELIGSFDKGQSLAVGDLNNDNYPDIVAQTADGDFDQVFYNKNVDRNNSLKVGLESFDDKDAIGAYIRVYGPWGVQAQRVISGESYGITNSLSRIFGFDNFEFADSIVISWPDGSKAMHRNVLHDQHIIIHQNGCLQQVLSLDQSNYKICDTPQNIRLPEGYQEYIWSDGVTGISRALESGIYSAKMMRQDGCFDFLSPIEISNYEDVSGDIIQASNITICNGEPVSLLSRYEGTYSWSTNDTTRENVINQEGWYQLGLQDKCGNFFTDSIFIDKTETQAPNSITDSIFKGEQYTIELNEDQVLRSTEDNRLLSIGESYLSPPLDTTTLYYILNIDKTSNNHQFVGLITPSQSFSAASINSGITFDVHQRLILNSVKVYTEIAGKRQLLIKDRLGNTLHEKEIDVDTGFQTLDLNFFLDPGTEYVLTTDLNINLNSIGSEGPQFGRTAGSGSSLFPIESDGNLTLTGTLNGRINYYYYYDWDVSVPIAYCESTPALVKIVVKDPVGIEENIFQDIKIFPNPTSDIIQIEGIPNIDLMISLHGIDGHEVMNRKGYDRTLSLRSLPAGIYYLKITDSELSVVKKIIKL